MMENLHHRIIDGTTWSDLPWAIIDSLMESVIEFFTGHHRIYIGIGELFLFSRILKTVTLMGLYFDVYAHYDGTHRHRIYDGIPIIESTMGHHRIIDGPW